MIRHRYSQAAIFIVLVTAVASAQAPNPVIAAVVNGASFDNRLCPGLAAIIFGPNVGPVQASTNPAGLTVLVGNIQATILFGSAQQVNIVIPAQLPVGPTTVVVDFQGRRSAPFQIQLDVAAPGLFAVGGTGSGNGIFLTQDGRLLTGPNVATAKPGDILQTFAIGLGAGGTPSLFVSGRPAQVMSAVPASGIIGPFPGVLIVFQVPPGLSPGTHTVQVRIGGFSSNIVTLPLTAGGGVLLTQSGFTFQSIQGGGTPPSQTFQIINGTNGTLNFNLTTSTTSGGAAWLSVNPAIGVIQPGGAPPTITVNINPAGLAPGDYYGQISVAAAGASNSPQIVSIVLNVNPANVNPGPVVTPTGLIFVRVTGQANPAAQAIRITNLTNRASPFVANATFPGGARWFTHAPANGQVAPNQPVNIQVTADVALGVGIYPAVLTLQFPQDNVNIQVALVLVVAAQTPSANPAEKDFTRHPADCNATRLVPVLTLLGGSFTTRSAWPTPIETRVVDDCGSFLRTGSVVASFSNGDAPLPLTSAQDGRWAATWAPVNARTPNLQVTVTARAPDRNLEGVVQSGGTVQDNPNVPVLNLNGLVSSASYSLKAQPSPGELVAIFGARLADGFEAAAELPLRTQLQGATVTLAGRPLPLVFTSDGQVNAIVPYDIPFPATHQLIVRRGNRYSVPSPVTVLAAQPAVFSTDLSGKGQGHIYVATATGLQILADAANPARAGDVIVIYCAGLGPVQPAVTAGAAVPFDTLRSTVNPATVTIGGKAAEVAFAGVTPGFAGLYQVNLTVPQGVSAGDAVEVVLAVAEVSSPPVTIAVR